MSKCQPLILSLVNQKKIKDIFLLLLVISASNEVALSISRLPHESTNVTNYLQF